MALEKKIVLVIDDEEDFCGLVKRNLEASGGFQVAVCSDSAAAYQRAKQLKPDIILLDVMMPKISGPEIAEQLRASEETKRIPLVFVSAIVATQAETAQRRNRIGGEYMVAKPVSSEELIRLIRTITA